MLKGVLLASAVLLAACGNNSAEPAEIPQYGGWTVAPTGDLNTFFECLEAEGVTLLSAHRGGPYPGYPENAIETMAAVLREVPTLMEIDVAASSDGVLYLMHDNTLDRTTTGTGAAGAAVWADIAKLRLEDEVGRKTKFAPPRFSDALQWAKGRTILQVDFKPSARYEAVIDEINRQDAEDSVILIAYTLASARKLHRLAPEMMISLGINSQSELNGAVAAGIPANRLMGFTGTEAPRPRLFSTLNARNVEVIFGTLGGSDSIDREIARSGDAARYADIAAAGVDIIATDRPKQAHGALVKAGRAPENGVCGVTRG
jgi:glycerophosphoryl diester phosphodiesterase